MARFQFGNFGVSPSLPLLPGSFWPRVVVPVRIPFIGQLDLFEIMKWFIIIKFCWEHEVSWLSCTIYPYQLSFLKVPFCRIQCSHRVNDYKFLLLPTVVCLCVRIYWRMSLISLSWLYQLNPAGLFWFIWTVFKMGGKWSYSCYFVYVASFSILL